MRSCSTGPTPPASWSPTCKRDPVDLLVVGSHGHGLVRDLLLGQTVDRVRHHLEVPMLIARPGREGQSAAPMPPAGSGHEEDGIVTDAMA